MRDFVTVMSGFKQATKLLSVEIYETASIVIPLFQTLKRSLATPTNNNIETLKTPQGKYLRSALEKSLDFYMNKYKYFSNDLYMALTFLDPRYFFKLKILKFYY